MGFFCWLGLWGSLCFVQLEFLFIFILLFCLSFLLEETAVHLSSVLWVDLTLIFVLSSLSKLTMFFYKMLSLLNNVIICFYYYSESCTSCCWPLFKWHLSIAMFLCTIWCKSWTFYIQLYGKQFFFRSGKLFLFLYL